MEQDSEQDRERRRTGSPAAAALLLSLGGTALVLAVAVCYSLTREYGGGFGFVELGFLALVPALLLAAGFRQLGVASRVRVVLAVAGAALPLVAVPISVLRGESDHAAYVGTPEDSITSPTCDEAGDERVVAAYDALPLPAPTVGDAAVGDGTCTVEVDGDADETLAFFRAVLPQEGWRLLDTEDYSQTTAEREGITLRVYVPEGEDRAVVEIGAGN